MRLCPTVEGSPSPLITHRIGVDDCQARQRSHFHKCHRCVYRGRSADWMLDESVLVELESKAAAANAAAAKAATNGLLTKKRATQAKVTPKRRPAPRKRPARVAEADG